MLMINDEENRTEIQFVVECLIKYLNDFWSLNCDRSDSSNICTLINDHISLSPSFLLLFESFLLWLICRWSETVSGKILSEFGSCWHSVSRWRCCCFSENHWAGENTVFRLQLWNVICSEALWMNEYFTSLHLENKNQLLIQNWKMNRMEALACFRRPFTPQQKTLEYQICKTEGKRKKIQWCQISVI